MNLSDKIALYCDNGLFVSFASVLAREFGRVLYWSPWWSAFPKSNDRLIGQGVPNIERVNELFDVVDQADIVIFPDVYMGDFQVYLADKGKRVWGGRYGEELELDRWGLKKYLTKVGLSVAPAKRIVGTAKLREYLKEHDDVWVKVSLVRGDFETHHAQNYRLIEPWLDHLEHRLGAKKYIEEFIVEDSIEATEVGYDGFTVDGKWPEIAVFGWEIKDTGYLGAVKPYAELPEPVRLVNSKIQSALARYHYRGFFSTEIRYTEKGEAFLTDPCCYPEETEVLTECGWKRFSELDRSERIFTLNPDTKTIEYQHPVNYVSYEYEGDLIEFTSPKKVIELAVTPNHSMWVFPMGNHQRLTEVKADKATMKGFLPRSGSWVGKSLDCFVLPGYEHAWDSGMGHHIHKQLYREPVSIPIRTWLKFLAFYLAEGNCDEWVVNLSQTKYTKEFREVVSSLPFKWSEHAKGFRIFDVQLVTYLRRFPKRDKRGIDPFVKQLSPDLINVFLDAYCMADGQCHRGQRIFSTTSHATADDLQELCLKAGFVADVKVRTPKGQPVLISNGKYLTKHDSLIVTERRSFTCYYFEGWNNSRHSKYLRRIPYKGRVFCVEVPNHIIYVRRNGKPVFCGNCRAGSPPNEVYQELYSNWGEIIWNGSEGKMTVPKPVAKYAVEALIHSSWADKEWAPIYIPEEARQWVKLRNHTVIDGKDYVVPQSVGLPEIGAVVGIGDTLLDAVRNCKKHAEQVEGFDIDIKLNAISEAITEIEQAQALGITFTDDKLPTVEEVNAILAD